jgi:hypothetical protein
MGAKLGMIQLLTLLDSGKHSSAAILSIWWRGLHFCIIGLGGRQHIVFIILNSQDQLRLALYWLCDTYNVLEHVETSIEGVVTPMMLGIRHLEIRIQCWRK